MVDSESFIKSPTFMVDSSSIIKQPNFFEHAQLASTRCEQQEATGGEENQNRPPNNLQSPSKYETYLSSFVIKTPRTWKILVDPTVESSSSSSPNQATPTAKPATSNIPESLVDRIHVNPLEDPDDAQLSRQTIKRRPRRQSFPTIQTRLAPAPSADLFQSPTPPSSLSTSPRQNQQSTQKPISGNTSTFQAKKEQGEESFQMTCNNLPQQNIPIPSTPSQHHPSQLPREYTFVPDRRSFTKPVAPLVQRRSQSFSIPMPSCHFLANEPESHHLCDVIPLKKDAHSGATRSSQGAKRHKSASQSYSASNPPSGIPHGRPATPASMTNTPPPPPSSATGTALFHPSTTRILTFHQTEFDSKTLRPIDRPLEDELDLYKRHMIPLEAADLPAYHHLHHNLQLKQQRPMSEGEGYSFNKLSHTLLPPIEEAAQILLGLKSIKNHN